MQHRWRSHIVCAKHNTVCRRQPRFVSASGMMLTYDQMMFATALQNDVVSCGHKHKKKHFPKGSVSFCLSCPKKNWSKTEFFHINYKSRIKRNKREPLFVSSSAQNVLFYIIEKINGIVIQESK